MAKHVEPVEWTFWEAVVALNDPVDIAEHERLRAEPKTGLFSSRSPKGAVQAKLNGTVMDLLRAGRLRAVGRTSGPLSQYVDLPVSTWVEYELGSYRDSYATLRSDRRIRIYEVRIAPAEWGDALVRKYVLGMASEPSAADGVTNKGGAPSNPHWEEVFDALLAPLIRPAEFESQQHLIEAIEETFQRLGYESPTQDGIRKRLRTKWPNLKALALRRE